MLTAMRNHLHLATTHACCSHLLAYEAHQRVHLQPLSKPGALNDRLQALVCSLAEVAEEEEEDEARVVAPQTLRLDSSGTKAILGRN